MRGNVIVRKKKFRTQSKLARQSKSSQVKKISQQVSQSFPLLLSVYGSSADLLLLRLYAKHVFLDDTCT